MKLRVRRHQWQQAFEMVPLVREKHSGDSDALALAAQISHRNERPNLAADLLCEACLADQYVNSALVEQTLVALTQTGRLFDGIDLLEQAVDASPDAFSVRRLLFDLLMGVEDRVRGLKHGRYLIQKRQFDAELLLTLSDTVQRSNDPEPLLKMVERNPDDKRPLIGKARILLDEAKHDEADAMLLEIIEQHPDFGPAFTMHLQTLAQANRFDELQQQCKSITPDQAEYPRHWVAIGTYLATKGQALAAARAHWQAIQLDPDWLFAWNQLINSLQAADEETPGEWTLATEEATKTASLLAQFNQARSRFIKTGGVSRELSVQMADLLRQLGRLWEAEAWTAIALTLPDDTSVPVDEVRQSIVSQMRAAMEWYTDPPWQPSPPSELAAKTTPRHWSADLNAIAVTSLSDTDQIASEITPLTKTLDDDELEQDSRVIVLENEAQARNLRFFGRTSDNLDKPGIRLHHTLGCGGGTLDYDLDGWPDLYLAAAGGEPTKANSANNALMRNQAGMFANVTGEASADQFGFTQGIACGDVNEDGFADLVVLNYGEDAVFINQGDGTFRDATTQWLSSPDEENSPNQKNWSTCGAIADLDLDGLSDLVIAKYCAGLEPATVTCPLEGEGEMRSCTPVFFNAEPDVFYQGAKQGSLQDATQRWNAEPVTPGRGLGLAIGCFDSDSGLEVLVANDMTANHFWKLPTNQAEPRIAEVALPRGLAFDRESRAQGSMGIATGDLDLDGRFDFYVSNFDGEYNTLSMQRSEGIWQDTTGVARLDKPTRPWVGFGTQAIDFDNDQMLEVVVTNGHVDLFNRGEERSIYAQPMQIFAATTDGRFRTVTPPGDDQSYLAQPHVGRALWLLDADRDGQQDLVVTHQTEPVALLMNRTPQRGRAMDLKLVGTSCSRDAVGATATIDDGDRTQIAQITSGDGYLCSNEKSLHFAISDHSSDLTISVRWPDGATETFSCQAAAGESLLVQGTGEQVRLGSPSL